MTKLLRVLPRLERSWCCTESSLPCAIPFLSVPFLPHSGVQKYHIFAVVTAANRYPQFVDLRETWWVPFNKYVFTPFVKWMIPRLKEPAATANAPVFIPDPRLVEVSAAVVAAGVALEAAELAAETAKEELEVARLHTEEMALLVPLAEQASASAKESLRVTQQRLLLTHTGLVAEREALEGRLKDASEATKVVAQSLATHEVAAASAAKARIKARRVREAGRRPDMPPENSSVTEFESAKDAAEEAREAAKIKALTAEHALKVDAEAELEVMLQEMTETHKDMEAKVQLESDAAVAALEAAEASEQKARDIHAGAADLEAAKLTASEDADSALGTCRGDLMVAEASKAEIEKQQGSKTIEWVRVPPGSKGGTPADFVVSGHRRAHVDKLPAGVRPGQIITILVPYTIKPPTVPLNPLDFCSTISFSLQLNHYPYSLMDCVERSVFLIAIAKSFDVKEANVKVTAKDEDAGESHVDVVVTGIPTAERAAEVAEKIVDTGKAGLCADLHVAGLINITPVGDVAVRKPIMIVETLEDGTVRYLEVPPEPERDEAAEAAAAAAEEAVKPKLKRKLGERLNVRRASLEAPTGIFGKAHSEAVTDKAEPPKQKSTKALLPSGDSFALSEAREEASPEDVAAAKAFTDAEARSKDWATTASTLRAEVARLRTPKFARKDAEPKPGAKRSSSISGKGKSDGPGAALVVKHPATKAWISLHKYAAALKGSHKATVASAWDLAKAESMDQHFWFLWTAAGRAHSADSPQRPLPATVGAAAALVEELGSADDADAEFSRALDQAQAVFEDAEAKEKAKRQAEKETKRSIYAEAEALRAARKSLTFQERQELELKKTVELKAKMEAFKAAKKAKSRSSATKPLARTPPLPPTVLPSPRAPLFHEGESEKQQLNTSAFNFCSLDAPSSMSPALNEDAVNDFLLNGTPASDAAETRAATEELHSRKPARYSSLDDADILPIIVSRADSGTASSDERSRSMEPLRERFSRSSPASKQSRPGAKSPSLAGTLASTAPSSAYTSAYSSSNSTPDPMTAWQERKGEEAVVKERRRRAAKMAKLAVSRGSRPPNGVLANHDSRRVNRCTSAASLSGVSRVIRDSRDVSSSSDEKDERSGGCLLNSRISQESSLGHEVTSRPARLSDSDLV